MLGEAIEIFFVLLDHVIVSLDSIAICAQKLIVVVAEPIVRRFVISRISRHRLLETTVRLDMIELEGPDV